MLRAVKRIGVLSNKINSVVVSSDLLLLPARPLWITMPEVNQTTLRSRVCLSKHSGLSGAFWAKEFFESCHVYIRQKS